MRTSSVALIVVAALGLWSAGGAQAHGPGYWVSPHVSFGVGIGLGYPYAYPYRPYPYYYPYYPGYFGVEVWPRARTPAPASQAGRTQLKQLYVYPAGGQSAQQLADDRYACHTWSVDQTGFDPTLGAGSVDQADAYARAMTACLEARNYVVR
jgi:hypothetical protein